MASGTKEILFEENQARMQHDELLTSSSPEAEMPLRSRPANENDGDASLTMANLRRKPSSVPFVGALTLTLLWGVGWFSAYFAVLAEGIDSIELLRAVTFLCLPIFCFWTMAYFIRRAQHMREVSVALIQTSLRLMKPQDIAVDSLISISQTVRSEIDLLVGGVEHAVERATSLERVVHREIAAIERAFGGNEDRIRVLVAGLENQRAALQQASLVIGNQADPLIKSLETNTENLDRVINSAQSTLDSLEDRLKGTAFDLANAIEDMAQRASLAGSAIDGQTEQMERMSGLLVGEVQNFSALLRGQLDELSQVANLFGPDDSGDPKILSRLNQTVGDLASLHQDLNISLDKAAAGSVDQLQASATQISETLQAVYENATRQLQRVSGDAARIIEHSSQELSHKIETSHEIINHDLSAMTGSYFDRFHESRSEFLDYLQKAAEDARITIENTGIIVSQQIEHSRTIVTDGLANLTNEQIDNLARSRLDFLSSLQVTSEDTRSLIEGTVSSVNQQIERSRDLVAQGLSGLTNEQIERLELLRAEITQYFEAAAKDASMAIERSGGVVSQQMAKTRHTLTQGLSDFAEGLLHNVAESQTQLTTQLSSTLDEASENITRKIDVTTLTVANQLELAGKNVDQLLAGTSGTVVTKLVDTADHLSHKIQESGASLIRDMEASGGDISQKLVSLSGDFVQNINNTRDDLFALLAKTSVHMTGHMEQSTELITEKIGTATDKAAAKIADATDQLAKNIDHSSEVIDGLLEDSSKHLENKLHSITSEVSAIFEVSSKMLATELDKSAVSVTKLYAGTVGNVTKQVSDINEEVTDRLEKTSEQISQKLYRAGDDLSKRLESSGTLIVQMTGEVSGRLSDTASHFAEAFTDASGKIFDGLGQASKTFAKDLEETTTEINNRFNRETSGLVGRVDRAALEFELVASDSSSKLESAYQKFSQHIETANVYLGDQLSSAALTLDERLEKISMLLTNKLETTSTRVSEQLEDVTQLVRGSLDQFNTDMGGVLVDRNEALSRLISDVTSRSRDIESVMSSYMRLIEESLDNADLRAKEIARVIAEQTKQSLLTLEGEIKKLETSSGGQMTQASRILREQHERAISAMNEMLSSATSDFQQTAQDMRITAQQVVKDVDAARSELKRALFELPEETRHNADAMRRVVADQIAALSSLADMVKRQSGVADISGLQPPAPMRALYDNKTSPKAETTLRPAASESQQSLNRTETAETIKGLVKKLNEQVPAGRMVRGRQNPQQEMDVFVQKLNAAARDLVEAFDGVLPDDLELRYKNGARDIYTRRLYEGRGKRMEKIVSARYKSERAVRGKADAYMLLFEQLLNLLSGMPAAKQLMEQSMASESGKIYSLLAEASGRQ